MPIFFHQTIAEHTRLAIWKIEEAEDFFQVPLQRSITHPHKRLQHLAGRFLLRYLFPDFPLNLIKVADTRKPFLENEAYHFSISHCSNYAAAIVSKSRRVGIDIEVPTHKVEKIRHKFLHPRELQMVTGTGLLELPEQGAPLPLETASPPGIVPDSGRERQNLQLTLLWSAKEAVFKWWSYGNVDFSEMIRLQPFELQPAGNFIGCFLSGREEIRLTVQYRLFKELCLAWVVK